MTTSMAGPPAPLLYFSCGGVGGGYTETGGGPGPSYNAARQNLLEGIHGVFLLAEGWAEVSLSADRKSGIPHGRDKTPPVTSREPGLPAPSKPQTEPLPRSTYLSPAILSS